jgi:hypothetical protein
VIPVALIYHWLLLHWPSVAGPIGSRGTVDPRAYRDLAVVRYDALSEMSGQLSRTHAKIVRSGAGMPG